MANPKILNRRELRAINSARREMIAQDLIRENLSQEYLESLERNPGSTNPYHGNEHLLAVAILALRAAYAHLYPLEDRQAMLIAGLFHDYGYDLSKSEPENIGLALQAAKEITERLNPEIAHRVSTLIRDTEFPHRPPITELGSLLQDADLLMISQPDFSRFLMGLRRERPELVADPLFPGLEPLNSDWGKRLYSTGRELVLAGDVVEDTARAIHVGATLHEQTMSSRGFLVDRSISEELEALWGQGFDTLFSCGGDRDGSLSRGWTVPARGYIAFTDVSFSQFRKIHRATRRIGNRVEHFRNPRVDGWVVVARFTGLEAPEFFKTLLD